MKLPKIYNPKETENKIYKLWEKSGFFNPDKLPLPSPRLRRAKQGEEKTFVIVIPPPNITGELHMGHALNAAVQDVVIRFKRLQGFKTLWVPGTDHAGIAAQNVVEKKLKEEGKTRFDLGKDKFMKRMWAWMKKYEKTILDQFRKLGCSLDWSRKRFTMDKGYSKAVKEAFFHYYKKGLIYKEKRPVNFCSRCETSLSDLELEYKEKKGGLWYVMYPVKSKKKKFITVATTRPETMLGDTAIAVNPKDKRYKKLIGKKALLPLAKREIPIISDLLVDPQFGTGIVKVTPAHDLKDYEISLHHKLKMVQVIDKKGKITKEAPSPYQGLPALQARKIIIEDLKKISLLKKVEDVTHQIPHCYRCQTIIEILPSEQWFLKMGDLSKLAEKPVKEGKIKFYPKNLERVYLQWLKNVRDWCISRQIWWGHKIPLKGEKDVLDTWFSSALWPFVVLGWPAFAKATAGKPQKNKKTDLERFYPTSLLSTDRGIINLWVVRMIFSSMEFMKKIPFRVVYIHPTVLTREGKRMSKSLGTGVDPIHLIGKYGADATRFGILFQIMGGQDIKFIEDNIIMGKKFCNKIWNAARFVLLQKPKAISFDEKLDVKKLKNLTVADKKILKALQETIKSVKENLDNFQFGKACHKVYDFFWHDFCDTYIEESKEQMMMKKEREKTKKILLSVLLSSVKILHPFLPFITEEIYQILPIKRKKKFLMVENWPQ